VAGADTSATFEGLRVLELGDRGSTAWCARMFADLGADVLLVEPPGGHPLRADPPAAAHLLANRRRADPARLADLATTADLILTGDPGGELSPVALRAWNPRALIVAITPYGLEGEHAAVPGDELTAAAMGGWASMNGLADREPLKGPGYQAAHQAGTFAWAAATAALLGGTPGEVVDVAERDVLTSTFAPAILRAQYTGRPERRRSAVDVSNGPVPVADGFFALTLSRPHFWQHAMRILGLDDLADDPDLQTSVQRATRTDRFVDRVQERLLGWKRMELFDELAARRVIAGPVLDMADLATNPQLEARGFSTSPASAPDVRMPGPPVRYGRSRWHVEREAPAPDEAVDTFRAAGFGHVSRATGRGDTSGPGPLAGYRGLVLTQAWAGTYTTELLALLGAEIVQVENRERFDSWRGGAASPVPDVIAGRGVEGGGWDVNPLYNSVNLGKRTITLDLASGEGSSLFRRLLPRFDFVAENFSPRVMGNLGLAYDDLARLREDIILLSLSAYGHDGPWSNVPGIGGTIEPSSGMSALLGYPGGAPTNSGQMYPDPVAGLYGLGAVVTALLHRERTGEGQYIDLSMQEACLTFIGDAWMRYRATGEPPGPEGNRHPVHAPHGIYPCAGEDDWIAVTAAGDGAWRAVCSVLGAELADDPRFATAEDRKAHEDDLDAALAAATRGRRKWDLFRALTAAGATAAPVLDADELAADQDLRRRGVVREVEHARAGPAVQAGLPVRFARTPTPAWTPAPLHGEHSFEVLREELGLTEAEFEALVDAGVTGSGPLEA
jgi:crotonobetainyl-CoA:carnitine CoA-transferase CaiB-like acyl-CoA transferase